MKFFARKQMDFHDDEIKRLRRRLAEAEGRVHALEEKAEKTGFLEAVVFGVAEPILVIDRNYNIILKNPAADGFWGLPKGGKAFKCHEVLHGIEEPCKRESWPCPLRQVLETGKPVTVLHEHRGESGVRKYELLASPLVLSGELVGITETARDITERKALERHRSDFLAMVTHDLKSPLTAILGYSELIKDECERRGDESVRAMAEAVEQGGHRLLRLVEDFLTVSRMEAEKLELKKAPADIREVLAKVEKDFHLQAKNSGISLSAELPDGTMPQPLIDRPQVERVLGNLVQNAINYTPSGGSIIIGAEESSKDGRGYIKVFVSDTGRGIPKEEQEKVFSKYYRSSRTAGIRGSGLGLTIAKAITEAHGGWIKLESEPGKGSTFSLFLPV